MGITNNCHALVLDAKCATPKQKFDLIIADVPCTGSGIWNRTPEQLCFFEEEKIQEYAQLQQSILSNVSFGCY